MIDPEVINIRRDLCRLCKAPCDAYRAGEIAHHNPCVRCPREIWHHIDGEDCADSLPPIVCPTCPDAVATPTHEGNGPGSQLKRLLGRFGIHADEGCACNAMAAKMDAMGCDWCAANLDTIVDVMANEAARRRIILFSRRAAKGAVLIAISRARKAERML